MFRENGRVTAGNSCPLNDGAAAVVVMSRARAGELGITPLARILSTGVSALEPELMGLGPIESSRQALGRAGMTIGDVDVVEINEAFAAQVIPSARGLGVDPFSDKLNPHGGAIALGHPFGMTGVRILATLLNDLRTRGQDDRPRDHVRRRRPGHGHDRGAAVMTATRDGVRARRDQRAPPGLARAECTRSGGTRSETPARKSLLGRAAGALRIAGRLAIEPPQALSQLAPDAALELLRIAVGRSQIEPEKKDRRFADQAWQQNPVLRATMQAYLYWGAGVDDVVASPRPRGHGRGAGALRADAGPGGVGAHQLLLDQPRGGQAVLRHRRPQCLEGGRQPGSRHARNHGMPSMVDRRPFKLGENIAISPGAVIHRTEVFELIQYTPQRETGYERPLLVVPPQVNKYYALDLSHGRSMYEYLLKRGIQVFTISWRNPTGAQRDWNYDTYTQAVIEAIDVIREVSGSPDVNIMGGCLGGMTAALAQAHLAARGDRRIHSATMTVTMLDCASDGRMFLFAAPATLALARRSRVRAG